MRLEREAKKAGAQQIGQLAGIDSIVLVPNLQQGVSPRIANHDLCDTARIVR